MTLSRPVLVDARCLGAYDVLLGPNSWLPPDGPGREVASVLHLQPWDMGGVKLTFEDGSDETFMAEAFDLGPDEWWGVFVWARLNVPE